MLRHVDHKRIEKEKKHRHEDVSAVEAFPCARSRNFGILVDLVSDTKDL